jgi:hypothetical protein
MRKFYFLLLFVFLTSPFTVFSQYYVRGDHNGWGTSNQLNQRLTLGLGTTYSTGFTASFDQQFKIANNDYSNQWGGGFWITSYDQKWDIGPNGGNAIWKGSPSGYIQVNTLNPANYIGSNIETGIMTLSSAPVSISSVSQVGTLNAGVFQTNSTANQTVNITLSAPKSPQENIYLRYTTNAWVFTNWVLATGSGTNYSAVIPGQANGTNINYYVMSTTLTHIIGNNLDVFPDLMTLNFNNNSGSNYSYTINTALPVEFKNIQVTKEFEYNKLSWSTASETNNDYFEVQHSIDGRNFIVVGRVEGYGNSNTERDYSFAHAVSGKEFSYYRLMQVDFDGRYEYSSIVSVRPEGNKSEPITISPNPASDMVNVFGLDDNATYRITDFAGGQYLSGMIAPGQTLDVTDLYAGFYMVTIQNGTSVSSFKLIKQ